jgi:conjugative relaxase-like TrwC/TraI family protein
MLRVIQSQSVGAAKSYYTAALSKEGYYSEGQELPGVWRGKGAERLGLTGEVSREAFDALCDNQDPATGKRLTARMNDKRRVGYDINFHAPKSVSAALLVGGDKRVLDAFRESVRETMAEMEAEMKTRLRAGRKDGDKVTGNMIWGEFVHFTSRPAKSTGQPDPHLHAHCFVFNATFDDSEKKWKAGQFGDIKKDAPYFEAAFHARLAGRLAELGYGIERHAKGWELAGVPRSINDKYSHRTAEIEAEAKARGITSAKTKDGLGAKTRAGKHKGETLHALWGEWAGRLTRDEARALKAAKDHGTAGPDMSDQEAVEYALAHALERSSVITARELHTEALRHGVGSVSVEGVRREAARGDVLTRNVGGREYITTKQVLSEEQGMIESARAGRGQYMPLGCQSFAFQEERLNGEQRAAVLHVLRSRDLATGVRGGAGTGKTTMMREAVRGIEENGRLVYTFAPSSDASRGTLRDEGFRNAETLESLLKSKQRQAEIRGQVIWIDEAGQVSARQMAQVMKLAEANNARVILSGDIRQHSSVERGDALRLLEDKAGLKTAQINEIQRQRGEYKKAVAAISRGEVAEGFDRLDRMNAVVELAEDNQRYAGLASEYLDAVKQGKSVLAVAPTRAEGAKVSDAIREQMRAAGRVQGEDRIFSRLESLDMTQAERGNARLYEPGQVVKFTQGCRGFSTGARVTVASVDQARVEVVSNSGLRMALPLDQAARFQVYREAPMKLAAGDSIRITQNGRTVAKDGRDHELRNGARYQVAGFTREGNIRLNNGWVVRKDYGTLTHGYCSTSHASQGKTVDRVLIAQHSASGRAADMRQFYVSVSRGRESVRIFTDDKQAARESVRNSRQRMSATELVDEKPARQAQRESRMERVAMLARQAKIHAARAVEAAKQAAKQMGPRTWAERVGQQRRREMELG